MHKFNLIHKYMRRHDEIVEGGEGGGAPAAEPSPAAEPEGDKFDDLGYPITKEEPEPGKPPEEKAPEKPKEEEVVEDPATGYGEEPPKVPEPKEEPKEEPKPEDDKEVKFELITDGLEEDEIQPIRDFSKKHGVTKEVAQAMIDQKRSENERLDKIILDQQTEAAEAKLVKEAAWHKELKEDTDFGGEKFGFNLKQCNKVLSDNFPPRIIKRLTDSKGVLEPDVMRGFKKLADQLYSKERLTQGDPSVPKKSADEHDDTLDFYELES